MPGHDPARWSDDRFLDRLRRAGDPLADGCVAALHRELERSDFAELFRRLGSRPAALPADLPEPLLRYFEEATRPPRLDGAEVDAERLRRGRGVFLTHACTSAMALLLKSLPEGYAAPCLTRILALSDDLSRRPYRRLMGVLQMLVDVTSADGFAPGGKAASTVAEVRLLHAGVRHVVRRNLPDYEARFGVPVNLEDMLATVMGFSYLVVEGLRRLDVGLSGGEAEDFYYLWRAVAQRMGIHPPGEPDRSDLVPPDLGAAARFYAAYRRRHYAAAADNPEGVELARANLRMVGDLLPQTPLRRLGLQVVPRLYLEQLVGREACLRVGIRPLPLLPLTRWLLARLPVVWTRLWSLRDRYDPAGTAHENLSRAFFESLIHREAGGEITFLIPDSLPELRRLAGREDVGAAAAGGPPPAGAR